jgi:KDO2-lipid IV(A) lauroyltransferase
MAEPTKLGRTLSDAVTIGGFRLGSLAARALPGLAAAALATPIGFGASATNRDRRAMVERHLRRANPTLEGLALRRAVQEAFDSYARYWIESFRLPSLHKLVVEAGLKVSGYEYVAHGLEKGNGVILALPHLGGWEWAGRWLALRGVKITVVVEQLDPPELFDWFVKLRSELGMTVVALGPDAGKAVLGALKRNEVVCLLSDRDLDGRGVEVEFFGERTTLPAGPATLGIRTGAPILPTAVYFTPRYNGHFGLVRPPLDTTRTGSLRDDVVNVTQQLARELELLITRAPQQWHLFQPNWPSDPGYGVKSGSSDTDA